MIESAGCPLKTERGERVFPKSDKSSDVIKAFEKLLKESGVHVFLNTRIQELIIDHGTEKTRPEVLGIVLSDHEKRYYDKVILATGGKSYRSTGSDGNGYLLAQHAGHRIVPLRPSLVGITIKEEWISQLQGLSLKNVALTLKKGKKKCYHAMGEMLFTHFGISGPLVLSASAYMKEEPETYALSIDLKPGLTREQLESRILRDFEKYSNKNFSNALSDLLPSKLIPVMVKYVNVKADKKIHQITKEERYQLIDALKCFDLTISGRQNLDTAIITSGGIDVREIDPSTMASKCVSGLYFAGELIDVDALTGGFNIQIAASTGWLAGCEE